MTRLNKSFPSLPSSFRDPSGFVFKSGQEFLRAVAFSYQEHYDQLLQSGLYRRLTEENLLVSHEEMDRGLFRDAPGIYKMIKPLQIPFISYPYEWSFSQLKDAALLTLKIQRLAAGCKMTLKDASAFNIQFFNGKPIFIDSLSFEVVKPGVPWKPYRQFCENFLAPLLLMAWKDVRINRMSRVYPSGIPLDLASRMLPRKTWLNRAILMHIHLHALGQKKLAAQGQQAAPRASMSSLALEALWDDLEGCIKPLKIKKQKSVWAHYYETSNYSSKAMEAKKTFVANRLKSLAPKTVIDLGANTGIFSRLASESGAMTVAIDDDDGCMEVIL